MERKIEYLESKVDILIELVQFLASDALERDEMNDSEITAIKGLLQEL